MPSLLPVSIAFGLLALCVAVHASMLVLLLRRHRASGAPAALSLLPGAWLLVRVAWWIVLTHLVEIALWAAAYVWIGALPDFVTALYFSSVTYTTVGYGDVLLPLQWHLLAGVEGLTGILMAGWSTAFLFAVMNRLMTTQGRRQSSAPEVEA